MKILFLDTNVLLQCRELKELPWKELGEEEDITLLISRPVQEEIDQMKHDGNLRRARRSRAATSLIREMILTESSKTTVRHAGPRVELTFAPPVNLKECSCTLLDLSKTDDRLIAEAIAYRDKYPEEKVALLTHDTQPMSTARHCGLDFVPVPDEWLLPPEPDGRDKRILELERKLKELEQSCPVIETTFHDMNNHTIDVAKLVIRCYPALTDQQIEELIGFVLRRHPIADDFTLTEPRSNDFRIAHLDLLGNLGVRKRYQPPTQDEIHEYTNVLYPAWVENVRTFYRKYSKHLESPSRRFRLSVSMANVGNSPAENLLVEFSASGGLLLTPPRWGKGKIKSDGLSPAELPNPPEAPKGKWTQTLGAFESMIGITRGSVGYPARPLDGIIRDLTPLLPQKRDQNAFYSKPNNPAKPKGTWTFECDEFRHKADRKNIHFTLLVSSTELTRQGAIECRISARNLRDPVVCILPVKIEYEDYDTFKAAKGLIPI